MRLAIFSVWVASAASTRIDFSHQHHLGTDRIARSVGAAVANGGESDTISVDVSATILGDDGMSKLLQSIEEQVSEKAGRRQIGLELRSNRITNAGATKIFNKILGMTKATNETNVDELPYIESLDMSLNDLGTSDRSKLRNLVKSIEGVVESGACPSTLRLDCCGLGPAACRSIGKGLLNSASEAIKDSTQRRTLRSLYLSSNAAVGDAGAAALAAALRTAPQSSEPLLEVLDLSACGISDAGCEALAMAIRDNPGCVRKLDLSNNRITDDGAVSLALGVSGTALANMDLSNNKEITDRGAAALATAIERGAIKSLFLRSCSIKADGAEALGTALCTLASSKKADSADVEYSIDLSGNLLGTAKVQKKKGSASLLKSKASATTKAYMGFLSKKLRSGLNQAGISGFVPSAESDDDEEDLDDIDLDDELQEILDAERIVPKQNLVILVTMFVVVLFINLMKGGGAFTSPLGIKCGSMSFWFANIVMLGWIFAITVHVRNVLVKKWEKKEAVGYQYVEGDIQWDGRATIVYPAVCCLAGFFAGMFGVGGGIVKGPLMLAMGVHPKVSSASSACMILFTSFTATTSFIVFGLLIPDYAMICFTIGFLATLVGQIGLFYLMKKFQRNSYIAFSIGFVVLLSAFLMTIQSLYSMAEEPRKGHGSGGICGKDH